MAWRDDSFRVALRISNLANPMLTQKILLVEDEQAIADTLRDEFVGRLDTKIQEILK